MNHHPLHINDVYAKQSQQGRNVVVGPLVYSLALGMSVSDVSGKAIANLATEVWPSQPRLSWRHPVLRDGGARCQAVEVEVRPGHRQGPHASAEPGWSAGRRVQALGAGAPAPRRLAGRTAAPAETPQAGGPQTCRAGSEQALRQGQPAGQGSRSPGPRRRWRSEPCRPRCLGEERVSLDFVVERGLDCLRKHQETDRELVEPAVAPGLVEGFASLEANPSTSPGATAGSTSSRSGQLGGGVQAAFDDEIERYAFLSEATRSTRLASPPPTRAWRREPWPAGWPVAKGLLRAGSASLRSPRLRHLRGRRGALGAGAPAPSA